MLLLYFLAIFSIFSFRFLNAFKLEDAYSAAKLDLPPVVPGRFIVEYDDSIQHELSKRDDASTGSDVLASDLKSEGIDSSVVHELDSKYFSGVSVKLSNYSESSVEKLSALSYIKNVWPVTIVKAPSPSDDNYSIRNWNPHKVTGVDKLHEEGIYGDGIVVGIIDTGVNYMDDSLGGGFGEGFTVIGGHDYAGNDYSYTDPNSAKEDDDPMDCLGHGTFVSTVIAGVTKDIVGVAPNAKIRMYKVFGCEDATTNDLIMKALVDAASDGVNVINLSLGNPSGYSDSPISMLASSIADDNIAVVYAAGNDGEYGVFYASAGASGKSVISVASIEATEGIRWPVTFKSSNGSEYSTYYYTQNDIQGAFTGDFDADFTTVNACEGSSIASSSGNKVLILKRGICYGNNQYTPLLYKNYPIIFRYNSYNQDVTSFTNISPQSDGSLKMYANIEADVGAWCKAMEDAGHTLSVTLSQDDLAETYQRTDEGAGKVSYYSSFGPTFNNDFFPTVAAPGGHVYGLYGDTWELLSGTSFSSPYIAACVALFKGVYGADIETSVVKNKLVNTAKTLSLYNYNTDSVDDSVNHPFSQQGAGLVNAYNLIHYNTTVLSAPYLELNDTFIVLVILKLNFTTVTHSLLLMRLIILLVLLSLPGMKTGTHVLYSLHSINLMLLLL
ncbi:hydrolase activity protein [[Candida] boidinii]|nr:hydrolase activity protein [[Candida] boidinii]